jgi:hypothetical protein
MSGQESAGYYCHDGDGERFYGGPYTDLGIALARAVRASERNHTSVQVTSTQELHPVASVNWSGVLGMALTTIHDQ